MMDFTAGESQQAVAGLAASVLGGADPWQELARAGLLDLGEDGLSVLDTAVLLTEIGRHATDQGSRRRPQAVRPAAGRVPGGLPAVAGDLVRFLGGADYRLERLACTST
jgi:hypothetical protein